MKRVAMWFFLSCKRYMRKWSFLFILLLLPAGVLAAGQAQKKGSQDITGREERMRECSVSICAVTRKR